MILEKAVPFGPLLARQPVALRGLTRAALRISELEQIYIRARERGQQSLSEWVLDDLGVNLKLDHGDLAKIPASGPLVVVANHPFGFLDGLILHRILWRLRKDVRILVNAALCGLDEFADSFIPVDVFAPRGCFANVLAARRALEWVTSGHAVAIFPSGTVSHWQGTEKGIADPEWHEFSVRCARAARASILPIYIEGRNSLAFQLAGLVHPSLRTAQLPIEFLRKRGATVTVRIGSPITERELVSAGDERRATEHARARVYLLRHRPKSKGQRRSLFSVLPNGIARPEAISPPSNAILNEIQNLDRNGKRLVENETYAVYAETGDRIPVLLSEIGRLRELTFRQVQEGTGKPTDLDEFDAWYTHLILWQQGKCECGWIVSPDVDGPSCRI